MTETLKEQIEEVKYTHELINEFYKKLLKALKTDSLHPTNDYQKGYKDALEDLKRELFG